MALMAAILLILVGPVGSVSGEAYEPMGTEDSEIIPSQVELQLMAKINEARKNPLQTVAGLGLDPQTVLQQRPELKEILINGLPPLEINENLYTAAEMHTRDMLAQHYYSSTSADGRTVSDRMTESGYMPTACGENLGMLAFIHFLPPEKAVALIFENMLRDELSPDQKRPVNILNPNFKDIGVYLGTGSWVLESTKYNVYLASCDFGNDGVTYSDQVLIALINQARHNPVKIAEALGMDKGKLFENRLDLVSVLSHGLSPVTFNHGLYNAARGHVRDMLEKGYVSHISPDGKTPEDRLAEQDYEAITCGEAIGSVISGSIDISHIALEMLFEKQFHAEFTHNSIKDLVILNPDYNEIGVGFQSKKTVNAGSAAEENNSIVVFDLANRIIEKPCFFGVVYRDIDSDGNYGPGEGIANIKVQIVDELKTIVNEMETDLSGSFYAEIEPDCYTARVICHDTAYEKKFEINELNRFIEMQVQ